MNIRTVAVRVAVTFFQAAIGSFLAAGVTGASVDTLQAAAAGGAAAGLSVAYAALTSYRAEQGF